MIIDRIEGDIAIAELRAGEFEDVPLCRIQGRARDGAVIVSDGADGYVVDEEGTEERVRAVTKRMRSIFE